MQAYNSPELAFQVREVHVTSVSPDSVPILKDSLPDDAVLVQSPGMLWTWISLNVEHPEAHRQPVRYAINHAVDRDDLRGGERQRRSRADRGHQQARQGHEVIHGQAGGGAHRGRGGGKHRALQ